MKPWSFGGSRLPFLPVKPSAVNLEANPVELMCIEESGFKWAVTAALQVVVVVVVAGVVVVVVVVVAAGVVVVVVVVVDLSSWTQHQSA